MPSLILHIGWPKTGTTTLQRFFTEQADWLAGQGTGYYASRGDSVGDISRKIERSDDLSAARRAFDRWIEQSQTRTVLMSSEGLATNDPRKVVDFIDFSRWSQVTVVAYLRAQEAYLEGIYKQAIKWGNNLPLATCLGGAFRASAEYHRYLPRWQEVCDAEGAEFRVHLYTPDTLIGGDIRSDFCARLGLAQPPAAEKSENVSPSMALLKLYQRLPSIPRLQQINRQMVASGIPGVTGSGDVLSAAQQAELGAHFAPGNHEVCQRYFPDRNELFPVQGRGPAAAPDIEAMTEKLVSVIRELRGDDLADAAEQALRSAE